ncbi:MAG TPA: DUF1848 domain-containing protein [Clostridiales bacterium]|nr:DUF1848 domain-containing protein [Clostridiales bacterium]
MIVSASRRTDLPRWYGEWFERRLLDGYALVKNPMNALQVRRVSLLPADVDCFVFWTKDPENFLPKLDLLDSHGYAYYFQFTLTPYGKGIEPGMRDKREIARTFARLAQRLGRERVVWRYDPILLADGISSGYHRAEFIKLCELLAPYTDTVTVSFVDPYAKLKRAPFWPPTESEMDEIAASIGKAARAYGLRAVACCEGRDFTRFGIGRASCVDPARIELITGRRISAARDKNQRLGCGCCQSVDIGTYDTCPAGCVYCYASRTAGKGGVSLAAKRYGSHDPNSVMLC